MLFKCSVRLGHAHHSLGCHWSVVGYMISVNRHPCIWDNCVYISHHLATGLVKGNLLRRVIFGMYYLLLTFTLIYKWHFCSTEINPFSATAGLILYCAMVVDLESKLPTMHAWPFFASHILKTCGHTGASFEKIGYGMCLKSLFMNQVTHFFHIQCGPWSGRYTLLFILISTPWLINPTSISSHIYCRTLHKLLNSVSSLHKSPQAAPCCHPMMPRNWDGQQKYIQIGLQFSTGRHVIIMPSKIFSAIWDILLTKLQIFLSLSWLMNVLWIQ